MGQREHVFETKLQLEDHMNSLHLKIEPYKCDACDTSFLQKGDLKSHMKRKHSQNLADSESSESSAPKFGSRKEETEASVSCNANLQDPSKLYEKNVVYLA